MTRQVSPETRAKLREAMLRRIANGKHGRLGKRHSPETIEKIRKASTGKRYTEHGWHVGAKVSHCKQMAQRREILWELDDEEAVKLIIGNCHYCGVTSKPISLCRKGWNLTGVNGIDRIDSSLGYTPDNCVTCCVACNRAKSEMSIDEFVEWIKRVYSHLAKG